MRHFSRMLCWQAAVVLAVLIFIFVSADTPSYCSWRPQLPPLSGKKAAVATEVGQCSDIGLNMLKAGGNAADAVIASGLCIGVVAAYHAGPGGGGFMIVRFNKGDGHDYEMIDFREMAPAASNATMFITNSSIPQTVLAIQGLAVATPGEMRGWEMLHKRHGKLPWRTLFEPAIDIARHGFEVNADLASAIKDSTSMILADPRWSEVYAPNGSVLKQGEICYRKRYADALEQISIHGAAALYTGKIAANIAQAVQARGGILTIHDLADYTALVRETVNITYRNSRIFSTVSPSSGAAVLSALKIFEGYQANYTDADPMINVTTHRLIEATRFAFGQRTQYGDPEFTRNVSQLERFYLTDSVAAELRGKIIDNQTFPLPYYDPAHYTVLEDHGTSHMAVIDQTGMAVSLTSSINLYWGSQIMTADGIILNNQMDDFSSPNEINLFGYHASPANLIHPGKRPLSSIANTIAEDLATGEVTIATGSAGGSRIITVTLQVLHHYIDQGLSPEECTRHPRWHDPLSGATSFEQKSTSLGIDGYSSGTVAYMKSLGHLTYWEMSKSAAHIVARAEDGTIDAATDPRKLAGRGAAF